MKRALAILAVCSLFGFLAFGQGSLSGEWSLTATFDFGYVGSCTGLTYSGIDISSTLSLSYTICNWTFTSKSTFAETGFSAQQFSGSLVVGPYTFSTTMDFIPSLASEYQNHYAVSTPQTNSECCRWWSEATKFEPAFDKWKVTGSWTFGGVDLEAMFLLDLNNINPVYKGFFVGTYASLTTANWDKDAVQTACATVYNGSGWRFKISGTVNGCTFTSYTYFGLSEMDAQDYAEYIASLSGSRVTDYSLGKSGHITVANDNCDVGFTEEYLHLQGLSFGCIEYELALKITCTNGFESISFLLDDLPLLCCGVTTDLLLKFSVADKSVSLLPKFTMDYACVDFDIGVDFSDHTINGFAIYGLSVSYEWSDCLKFTSDTSFNSTYHKIASPIYGGGYVYDLVPAIICSEKPPVSSDKKGDFKVWCVAKERYNIWEKFGIEVCAPGCCGGEVKFTVTNYFGDHEVLKAWGWKYYVGGAWKDGGFFDFDTSDDVKNLSDLVTKTGTTLTAPTSPAVTKLTTIKYYAADTNALFNWAKTAVALTIPATDSINIKASLSVTAFGWENFDIGFTFKF